MKKIVQKNIFTKECIKILKPEAGGARKYCEVLKSPGILCKGTHENVIRFAPPLVIKKK